LGGGEWAAEEAWAHGADSSGDWMHNVMLEVESVVILKLTLRRIGRAIDTRERKVKWKARM
jgi:hypothetical protein